MATEDPPPVARAPTRLTRAVIEIEQHVSVAGWDQPPRLFALVLTADLLAREPSLRQTLGPAAAAMQLDPGHLTPVEQEDLPAHASLEELLAGIAWPPDVLGAALCVERVMLPPAVEGDMPQRDDEALRWVARHPERQEMRLAAAVLRDGARESALRFRAHDRDDAVLSGSELVPALLDSLADTFAD